MFWIRIRSELWHESGSGWKHHFKRQIQFYFIFRLSSSFNCTPVEICWIFYITKRLSQKMDPERESDLDLAIILIHGSVVPDPKTYHRLYTSEAMKKYYIKKLITFPLLARKNCIFCFVFCVLQQLSTLHRLSCVWLHGKFLLKGKRQDDSLKVTMTAWKGFWRWKNLFFVLFVRAHCTMYIFVSTVPLVLNSE